LKKFVYYVFTANAGEFFTVVIGVLLQIPAPLMAVQILAIDLGTDIFPSFSLGTRTFGTEYYEKKTI
jgi:magnesium-transporting ATPase (P-type)